MGKAAEVLRFIDVQVIHQVALKFLHRLHFSNSPSLAGTVVCDHLFGRRNANTIEVINFNLLPVASSNCLPDRGLSRTRCAGKNDDR
jgi:hypothetical protein